MCVCCREIDGERERERERQREKKKEREREKERERGRVTDYERDTYSITKKERVTSKQS